MSQTELCSEAPLLGLLPGLGGLGVVAFFGGAGLALRFNETQDAVAGSYVPWLGHAFPGGGRILAPAGTGF